jgi:ADP-ribose pyrophosphatase
LFDGTTQETGIIDHPGSVVIVPLMGKHVLILRQYRLALDETILELPAGTRGWDEDWLACAQRELREETGYRANTWKSLGELWPAPGITNELMAVYLATDLSPDPLIGDPDEVIEVQQLPLKDLIQMAADGRLQDAKSIVGLHRAAVYLTTNNAGMAR